MAPSFEDRKLSHLLGRFFESFDLKRGKEYVDMYRGWHDLVGVDIAAHCRPIDIKHDALIVEVDHPAWMQKLHLDSDRILPILRQKFPDLHIRMLHMRLRK